ncbi:hypothetical protein [Solitalea koreensis]|uniref:Uncharacterized protein n=1 Tax=Solitalea koreensis TaxID=543615 RepID=A0A521CXA0_9SPHI|nr:hypothetical protein [Solitalea koreensis]SMO64069.1 hypothetical protein SAMN06265350_1057 [Solitalea koreensis]
MKIIALNLFLSLSLFLTNSAKAQLGFAVATDANGSQLTYGLVFGYNTSSKAKMQAMVELRLKGYDKVFGATGAEYGHGLKTGFYVLIKSSFISENGKAMNCYGLGASAKTFDEAEFRAQRNMFTYSKWDEEAYTVLISKEY